MGGNTIVLFEVQTKQYFGPSLLTMGFLRQTRHHAIDRAVWKRHRPRTPKPVLTWWMAPTYWPMWSNENRCG